MGVAAPSALGETRAVVDSGNQGRKGMRATGHVIVTVLLSLVADVLGQSSSSITPVPTPTPSSSSSGVDVVALAVVGGFAGLFFIVGLVLVAYGLMKNKKAAEMSNASSVDGTGVEMRSNEVVTRDPSLSTVSVSESAHV